jgi:hypothetical protein
MHGFFRLLAPPIGSNGPGGKHEKPIVEDISTVSESGAAATIFSQKPAVVKQSVPLPLPKKEVHTATHLQERESKKNESPSTLSFNIFLYIVDKFKQDQD